MDEVESQQRLIDAAVSAAFGAWRSQLCVQLAESHALRQELEKKSEELGVLHRSISNFDVVLQENEQLRLELKALRMQYASATPRRNYNDLEHERDALLQDNKLKQKTIDSLREMVNYEKTKSKDWWRHSKSSSSPSVSARGKSLHYHEEASGVHHVAATAGGVPALSNQTLLQKLVSPLKSAEAYKKSPARSAESHIEKRASTRSDMGSATEDTIPPPPATRETKHRDGPMSFADFDATYSHGESSSELPPTMSPRPQSSPGAWRSNGSPLLHEHPGHSSTVHLRSDSTAPPSKSCLNQESIQERLSQNPSFNSLEVVSAHPVGRKGQKLKIPAPDEKLASAPVGNPEEPITVKSEPSESLRNEEHNAAGLMSVLNESLGETPFSFSSPKRGRDPERSRDPECMPHGATPGLQVAEDEILGTESDHCISQPVEPLPAGKEEKSKHFAGALRSGPLKEIKNDERILPQASNPSGRPSKKRKSRDGRGAVAIPIVAEDSENHSKLVSPARSNTSAYRRLGNLLEGPPPARPVLAKPSSRTTNLMDGYLLHAAASAKSVKKDQLDAMRLNEDKSWEWYESAEALLGSVGSQCPPQTEKKNAQTSPKNHATTLKAQHQPQRRFLTPRHGLPRGPEDEEPFRSRPLHRLNLGHFKINPEANAGIDLAYTGVIRKQDQRKCLPGCTRPECCGIKFRAIAGTLPKPAANGKRFLESDPSDDATSRQSDNDLLNNFLGPGSEEKIRTLTAVARENLLLEAKTKIAADEYGKMHRTAHERPKSPPGFWRTEMPGTQEEMGDRLDAKKREKEEVERRYREALKEDGKWMFADE